MKKRKYNFDKIMSLTYKLLKIIYAIIKIILFFCN